MLVIALLVLVAVLSATNAFTMGSSGALTRRTSGLKMEYIPDGKLELEC